MNKKNTRKGFTIVELVIVIAVIAILATVLVSTFGNIIEKANNSAAIQEAKTIYTNYVGNVDYTTTTAQKNLLIETSKGKFVPVINGALTNDVYDSAKAAIDANAGLKVGTNYYHVSHDDTAFAAKSEAIPTT